MQVFVSVGATYTPEQEGFVSAFEVFLSQNGCTRLTVGRGSEVIAFTRFLVESAVEKPESQSRETIANRRYPTIWNQLEASMAFGLKRPLLVILEKGLYQEAMLKDRLEFRVQTTSLDPAFFRSDRFKGVFSNFIQIAKERASANGSQRKADLSSLTVGELIRDLQPAQLWAMGAALVTMLSAVAVGAFWLGSTLKSG
jgi:hypothetical protein